MYLEYELFTELDPSPPSPSHSLSSSKAGLLRISCLGTTYAWIICLPSPSAPGFITVDSVPNSSADLIIFLYCFLENF